jgi:hypothetical protein
MNESFRIGKLHSDRKFWIKSSLTAFFMESMVVFHGSPQKILVFISLEVRITLSHPFTPNQFRKKEKPAKPGLFLNQKKKLIFFQKRRINSVPRIPKKLS